jgi:hypothetical protein
MSAMRQSLIFVRGEDGLGKFSQPGQINPIRPKTDKFIKKKLGSHLNLIYASLGLWMDWANSVDLIKSTQQR